MALLFDDGSSEYCIRNVAPEATVPFSVAAWFNSDCPDAIQAIYSQSKETDGLNYFSVVVHNHTNSHKLCIYARSSATYVGALTTTGASDNTWHHACGVFAAADDRRVYIDGGSKNTETTSCTPADLENTTIANLEHWIATWYFSGIIGEVAVWSVALTDADVLILSKAYSPLFVKPASLLCYWPLFRIKSVTQPEIINGYTMAEGNTPSTAAHPRIIYPAPQFSAGKHGITLMDYERKFRGLCRGGYRGGA
jgi:hypothetical protein